MRLTLKLIVFGTGGGGRTGRGIYLTLSAQSLGWEVMGGERRMDV